MLHRREGVEGAEERSHGDLTGVPGEPAAGGAHPGGQRRRQQQQQRQQPGEERRQDGAHTVLQCLGAELQGAAFHPLHHRRVLPQRKARQGAGVLGPVHAHASHAQLHRSRQVVEELRLGLPLHPGTLPDEEGPAAVSQRQYSDLQNPRGHLLQVQALQAPPQPVGGQGGPKEATQQEARPLASRPEQEQHAADRQLVLMLLLSIREQTPKHTHTNTCAHDTRHTDQCVSFK